MRWIDFHRWLSAPHLCIGAAVLILVSLVSTPTYAQPEPSPSTSIEVRLQHGTVVEKAQFTPKKGPVSVLIPDERAPVLRIPAGETVTLGRRRGDVFVRRGDSGLYARSLRFVPSQTGGRWSLEPGTQFAQTYPGSLSLTPDTSNAGGVLLINRVPLQDYVASVVAAEYGLEDREGAKAMAIVARTYALYTTKDPASGYDHVDGTASQVYRGIDVITEASRRAAQQTRGQILVHDGAPIQAVYFSSSGGHTADNEDVWRDSDPLPYLRGKKDPYDQVSPYHRWSSRINRNALLQALSRRWGEPVEGFLLGTRVENRRLATMKLLRPDGSRTEIEAATFRSVINDNMDGTPLKSTWFDARRQGERYVFEGRGNGHGVGLNQWGAHAMAQRGKTHRQILSFYYTDVRIDKRTDLAPTRPRLADDRTTPSPDTTRPDTSSRRVGW